jgi:hypothetical protein
MNEPGSVKGATPQKRAAQRWKKARLSSEIRSLTNALRLADAG